MLILRDSKLFFNFFSDIEYDEKGIHGESNVQRGLVDNVFGYSFKQFSDLAEMPVSLIKIRILQYLIRKQHHVKAKDVAEELMKLGYFVEEHKMQHILHMIGDVGFVRNRFSDEAKMIVYSHTALGKYVIKELIRNNRYIEHVVQKSLIPKKLLVLMWPLCKYCRESDSIAHWVYYSVINIYVFYNYVRILEAKELDWYKDHDEEVYRQCYSLKTDFEYLLDDLKHVFRSRLGSSYINCELLMADIKTVRDKFARCMGCSNGC